MEQGFFLAHNGRARILTIGMKVRPVLLVAEPEPPQSISIRKLVLETAKFNVLTAHSTNEAKEAYRLFPNVSALIIVANEELDCEAVIAAVCEHAKDKIPVIALSPRIGFVCRSADYVLPSHDPQVLLELVHTLLGDPREMQQQ